MNTQIQKGNSKCLVTLNDLINDIEYDSKETSDMYQEKGEIYDRVKLYWNLGGNSGGRYTNKFIHSIMSCEALNKFQLQKENDKIEKANKNGK